MDIKTQKKILIIGLIAVFLSLTSYIIFNSLTVQTEMVNEITDLQQNLNEQKTAISTVVRILEEEREEKKKLQQVKDTLQSSLQEVAIQMDSLQKTLNRREKALYHAKRKAQILEEKAEAGAAAPAPERLNFEDIFNNNPFRSISPLELRFRSGGENEY